MKPTQKIALGIGCDRGTPQATIDMCVAEALAAFGCTAGHRGGTFIQGGAIVNKGAHTFDPNIDHRMALSLAPMSLMVESVTIKDPAVVNKSYPNYWKDLREAGYSVE